MFEKRSGLEYTMQLYSLTVKEGTSLAVVLQRLQELLNTATAAHPDEPGSTQNDHARKQGILILVEHYFPSLSLKMRSMLEDKTVTCLDMLTELQKSKDATFVATAYTPPAPICLVAGDSPEVPTTAVKSAVLRLVKLLC